MLVNIDVWSWNPFSGQVHLSVTAFHWGLSGVFVDEPRLQRSITCAENLLPKGSDLNPIFFRWNQEKPMEAFQLEQKSEASSAKRCSKGAELLASRQFPHHIDRKSTIGAGLLLDQLQALSHPSTCPANRNSNWCSCWCFRNSKAQSPALLHSTSKSHSSSTCLIKVFLAACMLDVLWLQAGQQCGAVPAAPWQLCSPGSAGLTAPRGEQQSWRQLCWQLACICRALTQTVLVHMSFLNNMWKPRARGKQIPLLVGGKQNAVL